MSKPDSARQKNVSHSPAHSVMMQKAALLRRQAAKEFSRALHCAKKAVVSNKPELAVEWCRYAASVAWGTNPGFFYCHDLEQLLAEIGRKYMKPVSSPRPSVRPPCRFLHVMSVAYEKGGHTRVVSNWIETCAQLAPSEQHSILISNQSEMPVPSWLARSAQRTGGKLIKLPLRTSWLETAAKIRTISSEFDVIVLHIHPNDPLPNLVFHDQSDRVIFFNHADHSFTLGKNAARIVADLRPVGHDISVRSCAPTLRKVMLPLPLLDDEHTLCGKADARKKLGLPADALITLTIGEPYKFTLIHGYSFPDLVQSLCAGNPRVLIIAVGISESHPFPGLGQLVGGRFMPVGVVKDRDLLELYYQAADVYLDSFPCTSLTAVLDAARHGLPVQRLCDPYERLMWCDDLGLDSVMPGVTTQDEYAAGVLEWLSWSEDKRSELGGRFRTAVLLEHCGASWKKNWLDPALRTLDSAGPTAARPKSEGVEEGQDDHLSLAAVRWDGSSTSMLIATTILETPGIDWRIRISGIWRSVKPWLFDTAHDGMMRERFFIFRSLVKTVLPKPVVIVVTMFLHPILKRYRIKAIGRISSSR